MNASDLFRIHPDDNVGISLHGDLAGHKFALRDIAAGEMVFKYGFPIGTASMPIRQGEHVHTHNLKSTLSASCDFVYHPYREIPRQAPGQVRTFSGYRRADGQIGIRNDLWIIAAVGCINGLARKLAALSPYPALAITHPYGCSQLGCDHENTAGLLAALARHPNAGGVLILSLGCENNTPESFRKRLGNLSGLNVRFLEAQSPGDEVETGLKLLAELAEIAGKQQRVPIPESELRIGLKCGGSDGFSGITANALTGRLADQLHAAGASLMLSEVPEMFGAEQVLLDRCVSREVFDSACRMIRDFRTYFIRNGQGVGENPSPGNRAGGITTLEDKSLGCVQKGGRVPVTDVLAYGQCFRTRGGLTLLSAPGNDMVSATALAAAGCHMILFTTGRGTPWGTVVPTLKISSNTPLAEKKPSWIDFDAGRMLSGPAPEQLTRELEELVLQTASGQASKNERNDCREIAIFKNGITL